MFYAMICIDKPNSVALRMATRPTHIEYLKGLGSVVKLAGPFMTEDGAEPRGSLIVVEAATIAEARKLADNDPYSKAGLFASVDIRLWSWGIGKP